jgi:hypothetical protein
MSDVPILLPIFKNSIPPYPLGTLPELSYLLRTLVRPSSVLLPNLSFLSFLYSISDSLSSEVLISAISVVKRVEEAFALYEKPFCSILCRLVPGFYVRLVKNGQTGGRKNVFFTRPKFFVHFSGLPQGPFKKFGNDIL